MSVVPYACLRVSSRRVAGGVTFLDEPKQMPFGTYVRFRDPDGNEFLLKG